MTDKNLDLDAPKTKVFTCLGILAWPSVVSPVSPKDWGDGVKDPVYRTRIYIRKEDFAGSKFEKELNIAVKYVAKEKFGKGVKFARKFKSDGDELKDPAATDMWSFTANLKPTFGRPNLYNKTGHKFKITPDTPLAELERIYQHGAYAMLCVKPYAYKKVDEGVALSLLGVKLCQKDGEDFADIQRGEDMSDVDAEWGSEGEMEVEPFGDIT